jgi:5-methylcytosine-specific restriction endonuclease McrA
LPSNWADEIVPYILDRDQRICHVCGQPGATQVDHIEAGDDHRPENLGAIHDEPCHRRKSSAEGNAARWKFTEKRPKQTHPGLT